MISDNRGCRHYRQLSRDRDSRFRKHYAIEKENSAAWLASVLQYNITLGSKRRQILFAEGTEQPIPDSSLHSTGWSQEQTSLNEGNDVAVLHVAIRSRLAAAAADVGAWLRFVSRWKNPLRDASNGAES